MTERPGSISWAIKNRLLSESKPGYRDDPYKIGLVIEGGCMAGVVSAGMGLAFGKRAMFAFDSFWGVSAGAATAAGILAGVPAAISIFYENVNNRQFYDPARVIRGGNVVDIPYLTYSVMKDIKPLDWKRVVDSPIELHIIVTEAHKAVAVDFCHFESQNDLLDAIHWSCRIPLIAEMPFVVDQVTAYTDGGVATGGIAFHEALSAGCTHLMVLRSGMEGLIPTWSTSAAEVAAYLIFLPTYPKLAETLLTYRRKKHNLIKTIVEAKLNDPTIDVIGLPPEASPVSEFEMDRRKLIRGAREGYYAAAKKIRAILCEP